MELKQLTDEQIAQLQAPLPKEAVKPHPSKPYLSTIKGIFVTERLNQVFGLGKWYTETKVLSQGEKQGRGFTATVDCTMYIPEYGFTFQSFGGSDNDDLGDALKGANTDATTKIAAVHLHVGVSVYKGEGNEPQGNTRPILAKEVTPTMSEPTMDDFNAVFGDAVVPEKTTSQHKEVCKKCGGLMDYKEGISKQKKDENGNLIPNTGGKPYKMWKCSNDPCKHVQFINTK